MPTYSDADSPSGSAPHASQSGQAQARYSGLAFAALVLALFGVASCLAVSVLAVFVTPAAAVGLALAPAAGLTAAILGLIAIYRINRSGGLLMGRGPALIGVFVGIMGATVTGSAVVGAIMTMRSVAATLAPRVALIIPSLGLPDPSAARASLAPAAIESLTDDQILAFSRAVRHRMGEKTSIEAGLGLPARTVQLMRQAPGARTAALTQDRHAPRPVEIIGPGGRALMYVVLDQDSMDQGRILIADLLFIAPDFAALPLRPDGPAAEIQRELGLTAMPDQVSSGTATSISK